MTLSLTGHEGNVLSCMFPDTCEVLLSTSEDRTAKLWDMRTGQCEMTLEGHTQPVTGCASGSHGHHVYTCSWDGSIRVWEAQLGLRLGLGLGLGSGVGLGIHVFEG